ncbi:uncharacterized protein TRIADDRAFT_21436 [Trichoplax adhaerens]|uniref:Uncharacterized protein n=1 Tax=Trichoplax adhaerens TaxID=10228 RepID=B3RNB7_TRIAD|nr:hypothetical protein TRIADDRAFT_21436 [Trichoplax adhaerens]EDV27425.1 hypothetical protein TRIADDRAFT_21436 [Trichoplax adhaerens]|eukprot:XP_002109259.1 hypothetical protein TRIADDRAFT_21436 [Trichoplax adhaerens]
MRPESLQIDKKTTLSSPWQTYQYFSQSCTKTYNLPVSEIRKSTFATNKTKVICVQGSTEITPFTGGTITFDATAGRAETRADFLQNPELSDWVTVSALKIELRRLNTFGDDNFGDENSYFYAISDIVVGGRCKCNGHGASCYYDNSNTLTCRCQHNTQGRDCQSCQSKFNDRPWAAATDSEANECIECKCNGLAESCNFNRTLYEATGSGGICVGCRNGATGINCQKCLSAYYPIDRNDPSKGCQNCSCNAVGSLNSVCDSMGRCRCKPGVAGDKCDRCQAFYYNFTSAGCSSCDCSEAGTRADSSDCDKITGQCQCKVNVIGKQCDRCITSHFALSVDNPEGCQRCFCFQHGTECLSASNYKQSMIKSDFQQGFDGWRITDDKGRIIVGDFLAFNWTIGSVSATVVRADSPLAYFYAPLKFRGDQRYSYGKSLRISISATAPNTTSFILTSLDVQILGGIGNSKRLVSSSLSRVNQSQILPSNQIRWYDLRLHEGPTYGWSPSLSSIEFQSILYNIEQVIIIAKFSGLLNSVVRLHNVTLQSAELINNQELSSSYILANYVEECTCAKPYGGLSCQLCADGYRRDQFGGTVYTECVPCQCNNQAATCNTTMCHCLNHTAGTFCENCQSGYYGEATDGGFCSRCPSVCNLSKVGAGGECLKDDQNKIICTNCRRGYAYPQCIHCSDGYYGDPAGIRGVVTPCQQCQCNGNIDPNAVGNCNRTTGECYKCIYNTEGFYCQQCLINYYGNALSPLKGKQCKACNCHPFGTNSFRNATSPCNRITGQCSCRKNVINRDCSQCKANFWGINSGEGCISCKNCSKTGSVGCDQITGDCLCKPNVGGELCDRCLHGFYNFSIEGCTACRCDPFGIYNTSNGRQCFENGTCTCRSTTIIGEKCDQCVINHHSLRVYSPQQPCQECDQCYGQFVKTYVNQRRTELLNLQEIIAVLLYNPTSLINVTQFEIRVEAANGSIQQLLNAMQVVVQQDIQMYTT